MSDRPEVEALLAIRDPVMREAAARKAVEDARDLMSDLADVRAQAIYEIQKIVGATKAARLFGTSRMNVNRIVRAQEQKDPDPVVKAKLAQRTAANAQLAQGLLEMLTHSSTTLAKARETNPDDEAALHHTEPNKLADGTWEAKCSLCGHIGVGPPLAVRELAQKLADSHVALFKLGLAGSAWNQEENLQ